MTASNVHADIRAAGRQALLAIPSGLPTVREWEGEVFSSTVGVPFLREQVVAQPSQLRSAGASGAIGRTVMHQMQLVWTLFYPIGRGTLQIEQAAGVLMTSFAPGKSLSYGGSSAIIQQCARTGLRQEPDWISCTVTATIVAYTFD